MSGACASRKHVGRPLLGPAHEMGWVGQETGGRRPTSTKKSILVLVPCSPDRGGSGGLTRHLPNSPAKVHSMRADQSMSINTHAARAGRGLRQGSNRADPARQGKVIASAPSHTME